MANEPEPQVQVSILDPSYVIELYEHVAVKKVRMPLMKMILLSILAGCYVGIGTTLYITLTSESHDPLTRVVAGGGFTTGLIMIVFIGGELFTGNCMSVLAVLQGDIAVHEMIVDLVVVWFGNFVGCILFATLILGMNVVGRNAWAPAGDPNALNTIGLRLCAVVQSKTSLEWYEMFLRGILANMLVCLAVLQGAAAKTPTGKIIGMMYPIMAFVVIGAEHSIANQYAFALATLVQCNVKNHGWYWANLVLSTLGNILGAFFLAGMYYATYLSHGKTREEVLAGSALAGRRSSGMGLVNSSPPATSGGVRNISFTFPPRQSPSSQAATATEPVPPLTNDPVER